MLNFETSAKAHPVFEFARSLQGAVSFASSTPSAYEWQSFLGLLPVLGLRPMDPALYQCCLAAVWRSRKSAISRTDLRQAAGLGFQTETLDFDLLLAQLVREEILEPIISSPFHFQIRRRNWTHPESAYAADDGLSLSAIVREEQTARFRMLGVLRALIDNLRLSERRVQQIRKERDGLERIYEATWLELENAIGSNAAERIRKSVEQAKEVIALQLELPLDANGNFDQEGEARCNQ
jgi:hypothetical protein